MTVIYICSTEARVGKTMVVAGLARHFQSQGLSVGYLQTVTTLADAQTVEASHAAFVKKTFGLADSLEAMAPFVKGGSASSATAEGSAMERILAAYEVIAQGKDVVLVEGADTLAEEAKHGVAIAELVGKLAAKVLLVGRYRPYGMENSLKAAQQLLGPALAGMVVNQIPLPQTERFASTVKPLLAQSGIPLWGVIPQARELVQVTVKDLIAGLAGEVTGSQGFDRIVENAMIGTINFEDTQTYFNRKQNKVVVTPSGRPDMALAALGTSTVCLVLTGGAAVDPYVFGRTQELGVPVVKVNTDTAATMEQIQAIFDGARLRQSKQVDKAAQLLAEHLDWSALAAGLGLPEKVA